METKAKIQEAKKLEERSGSGSGPNKAKRGTYKEEGDGKRGQKKSERPNKRINTRSMSERDI